jgi:Abnormal spindle-like microcephaly-assoc'd, ASPM-SPD-2-Hydin
MERRGVLPDSYRVARFPLGKSFFLILTMIVSLASYSCAGAISASSDTHEPTSQSKIVLIPNAVNFNNVSLGEKNTQTIKMSNADTHSIQIKNIGVAGAGLSITGLTFPISLAPQASRTFNVEFAPKTAGAVNGSLTIESNLATPEILTVQGVGAKAAPELQSSPASINFGKLGLKGTAAQTVKLTNTGNSKVTIKQTVLSGSGFAISGLRSDISLEPLQNLSFLITFHPLSKGAVTGSLKFITKELNVPVVMALAGDGVDAGSAPSSSKHTVNLSWVASHSKNVGYQVYRGETPGGPYTRLTASATTALQYSDSEVESGLEYFYVATSVDKHGSESLYSQEISVTIPNP